MDFVAHVRRESQTFLDALRTTEPDAPVPTCPEWSAADLLWHLGEVQMFWSMVVNQRITDGDEADAADASQKRPDDWDGLIDYFTNANTELLEGLTNTPSDVAAWTWWTEQTVGFIKRRQAHEALIHRIDAEITAGTLTAIDTPLASDGVDEVLRIMHGGEPPWGDFEPYPDQTVRIQTTDTRTSWLVTLGWFKGTAPGSGREFDTRDMRVAATDPGTEAAALIIGEASDLDAWLWGRPPVSAIGRTGNDKVLAAFDATIAPGIQ